MVDQPLDFFISYTGRDETWATWVAQRLELAGYREELVALGGGVGGHRADGGRTTAAQAAALAETAATAASAAAMTVSVISAPPQNIGPDSRPPQRCPPGIRTKT